MFLTFSDIEILDQLEKVGLMIRESEEYHSYKKYQDLLHKDDECRKLINAFTKLKEEFSEVERFGRYHPDFNEMRRKVNKMKKEIDLNPVVIEYRRAEYLLQNILDEVMYIIGQSVSEHANVVSHNPFFSGKTGGGCSTGSSCSCAS
ncbi:YlbF family regulator [Phocicoccus pinnipedialis]|uniref:Regulatory protein YlbF n=1 Tax=Phocicoccus pinnipedialis TaxID=110845 RepID=A0A6V7RIG7_9BACL|nr:YlbF family regulator [Jeotgalicoccus pinnipedialis]MBP1939023.1 cell fate (sporulation/competence/biofilm development) regulator YlbF (YheA/YmcA/DUF963 family) [Jeotgalicoccus pinnipedialis]CAD2077136.1 hypothetical protein JEOPIN946_01415 [Jeotgalicoccus pinnipedialis]